MTKEIIQFLQGLCVVRCADEELAPIGIGTGVSHGSTTSRVICQYRLIIESVARTTRACSLWITSLNNKFGNHTVEFQSIIEMMLSQVHKIIDGLWCQPWVEFQHNQTAISINTGTIDLICIDCHSGRLAESMGNLIESRPALARRSIHQFDYPYLQPSSRYRSEDHTSELPSP